MDSFLRFSMLFYALFYCVENFLTDPVAYCLYEQATAYFYVFLNTNEASAFIFKAFSFPSDSLYYSIAILKLLQKIESKFKIAFCHMSSAETFADEFFAAKNLLGRGFFFFKHQENPSSSNIWLDSQ